MRIPCDAGDVSSAVQEEKHVELEETEASHLGEKGPADEEGVFGRHDSRRVD